MTIPTIYDLRNKDFNVAMAENKYGYTLIGIYKILARIIYVFEHITGAKHVHISSADDENTFSVVFKTIPWDSTGVAHILEHTVLCGSKKFPVRDPFFSMLKRSLSTFMNAFTASDWTMYPFSTQNRKDFQNLMDVYLDAVFFPNLDRLSLKQEGHHLELVNGDKNLEYKGVVYNEMKGAMSSPDQILIRSLFNILYPDTTYYYNSGGDPADIPSLTHEELVAFHRKHYHPSNAWFYTYGDIPLEDHLAFINDKILKNFKPINPGTTIPLQPRWDTPKTASRPYPLGKHEDASKKAQVCMAWLAADATDTYEVLILTLLEQILLGNPGSPLRKALIDSGLGSSLSDGTGFDPDNRDTMFSCGLKNVESTAGELIKNTILDTLERLVSDGIDEELIKSAIHQLEFAQTEVTNNPYPYGLNLLLRFIGPCLHGSRPERVLDLESDLERLKWELNQSKNEPTHERPFENRINQYLLKNHHRLELLLYPDQSMTEKEAEREAGQLEDIKSRLSSDEIQTMRQDAEALEKLQETEEDDSVLPFLDIGEIPPSVRVVQKSSAFTATSTTCYNQSTSGILYFSSAIDIDTLPGQLIPLVPFFCFALPRIGTTQKNYVGMSRLIDLYTGGIGLGANSRTGFSPAGINVPYVHFNGKCLERNQEKMFEILGELISAHDFSDIDRLKNLLLEYLANIEAGVVHNGHGLALSLASRGFSKALALNETWAGIHQLKTMKQLTEELPEERLQSISGDLTRIGKSLFNKGNVRMALIGEESALGKAVPAADALQKSLGKISVPGTGTEIETGFSAWAMETELKSGDYPREGWFTSTAVSFVGQSFPTVNMAHEDAPALAVISKLLKSLYLHREIREKGGAYGGFALYSPETGLFSFTSYRDPHIVNTLDVYKRSADFIKSGEYGDQDIKESILQICSGIDRPGSAAQEAQRAFTREILLLNDDVRRKFKRGVLDMTRKRAIKIANKYFNSKTTRYGTAVISGESRLKAANEKLAGDPLKIHAI